MSYEVRKATREDAPALEALWKDWVDSKRGTRGFSELYPGTPEEIAWEWLLLEHTVLLVEDAGVLSAFASLTPDVIAPEVVQLQPFAFKDSASGVALLEFASDVVRGAGGARVEYAALAGDRVFKAVGEETGFKGAYVLLSRPL
jgi:hypothetical protein